MEWSANEIASLIRSIILVNKHLRILYLTSNVLFKVVLTLASKYKLKIVGKPDNTSGI